MLSGFFGLGDGFNFNQQPGTQVFGRNNDAGGFVLAEKIGIDAVDRVPQRAVCDKGTAHDDLIAAQAGGVQQSIDLVQTGAGLRLDAVGQGAGFDVVGQLAGNVQSAVLQNAGAVVAGRFDMVFRDDQLHDFLLL